MIFDAVQGVLGECSHCSSDIYGTVVGTDRIHAVRVPNWLLQFDETNLVSDVSRFQIHDHLVDGIEAFISEKYSLANGRHTTSWSSDDELLGDKCSVAPVNSDQPTPFFRIVAFHFAELDFFVVWAGADQRLSYVGK